MMFILLDVIIYSEEPITNLTDGVIGIMPMI